MKKLIEVSAMEFVLIQTALRHGHVTADQRRMLKLANALQKREFENRTVIRGPENIKISVEPLQPFKTKKGKRK